MPKKYILFDESAIDGNHDDASVLGMAESEDECCQINRDYKENGVAFGVWYEYTEKYNYQTGQNELVSGRQRMDLYGLL